MEIQGTLEKNALIIVIVLYALVIVVALWPNITTISDDQERIKTYVTVTTQVLVGALTFFGLYLLYYWSSTSAWRREQAFKEIKEIYEPIYDSLLNAISYLEFLRSFSGCLPDTFTWQKMKDIAPGRLLEKKAPKLYKDLSEFEVKNRQWGTEFSQLWMTIRPEMLSPVLLERSKTDVRSREALTQNIFSEYDFLAILLNTDNEPEIERLLVLNHSYSSFQEFVARATKIAPRFGYDPNKPDAADELFVLELIRAITRNEKVKEILRERVELLKEAKKLKNQLEEKILNPQVEFRFS